MAVPLPIWYGLRYPTLEDLEAYAAEMGAVVLHGGIGDRAFCHLAQGPDDTSVIGLSDGFSPLEAMWNFAHELAHLALHLGYVSPWTRDRQEAQAKRWAACALIPEARIRAYRNACQDALIAALSANFEDVPMMDCSLRVLAAEIAGWRLKSMDWQVA